MINVTLIGDRALVARLHGMPVVLQAALTTKVTALALQLQRHVQKNKLSGQVLKVRTGALRRSIHHLVESTKGRVVGRVASSGDVKYAAIHEFGGRTKAHVIRARKAEFLAFMGWVSVGPYGLHEQMVFRKEVNHPGSVMPERSFLRSSLSDMAQKISRELKDTVMRTLWGKRA